MIAILPLTGHHDRKTFDCGNNELNHWLPPRIFDAGGSSLSGISTMPVNILNLPDLHVTDFKETETDYHVRAQPLVIDFIT